MDLTTLLITGLVLLIVFLWFRRADPRLPPSPMRPLPIVGHLLYMSSDTRLLFKEWRQKCGDIYSFYMGRTLVVVLNGYDLINEALVKKADVFSDKPPLFLNQATDIPECGVLFSNGTIWKEHRAVTLSILRTFGMGKKLLAQKIEEEVTNYVGYLVSLKEKPTDIREKTNISTSNIICSILIGHRFDYDDHEFQNLMHKLADMATDQESVGVINYFPCLKYLPGDLFKAKRITLNVQAIMGVLRKFVYDIKRYVDDSNEVFNLIDSYILERIKKNQAGISTTMDDNNLIKIMFELFLAGTETTSTTIYWCVLYMLNYPEVQEKVYQEIKDKVGTDRTPTIQDKSQLTYLNAVISETQRLASIAPLMAHHVLSEEVTLRGYTVPKGSWIIVNLDSVLHDKDTWGDDVMSFRPERFIDDNGKLKIPEQFIPFGVGPRICLGESMSKMELFLFLSFMFQKFQFLPPSPDSIPPLNYNPGGVISPKSYKVRAVKRK